MRRVVDTNVPVTANGANGSDCAAACARALQEVMRGHLFIDAAGTIVAEYRTNLAAFQDPRAGNAFLKWVLTNEWNPARVTRVGVTPTGDAQGFRELPIPPEGVQYDPSDRVFLAIAAAHAERPQILQAVDSKWWGWQEALSAAGVTIQFLCPEIEQKYKEKFDI